MSSDKFDTGLRPYIDALRKEASTLLTRAFTHSAVKKMAASVPMVENVQSALVTHIQTQMLPGILSTLIRGSIASALSRRSSRANIMDVNAAAEVLYNQHFLNVVHTTAQCKDKDDYERLSDECLFFRQTSFKKLTKMMCSKMYEHLIHDNVGCDSVHVWTAITGVSVPKTRPENKSKRVAWDNMGDIGKVGFDLRDEELKRMMCELINLKKCADKDDKTSTNGIFLTRIRTEHTKYHERTQAKALVPLRLRLEADANASGPPRQKSWGGTLLSAGKARVVEGEKGFYYKKFNMTFDKWGMYHLQKMVEGICRIHLSMAANCLHSTGKSVKRITLKERDIDAGEMTLKNMTRPDYLLAKVGNAAMLTTGGTTTGAQDFIERVKRIPENMFLSDRGGKPREARASAIAKRLAATNTISSQLKKSLSLDKDVLRLTDRQDHLRYMRRLADAFSLAPDKIVSGLIDLKIIVSDDPPKNELFNALVLKDESSGSGSKGSSSSDVPLKTTAVFTFDGDTIDSEKTRTKIEGVAANSRVYFGVRDDTKDDVDRFNDNLPLVGQLKIVIPDTGTGGTKDPPIVVKTATVNRLRDKGLKLVPIHLFAQIINNFE